ncbi:MAG TPA: hypothetical protein VF275_05220 [Gammaproteobacteria bacterium]
MNREDVEKQRQESLRGIRKLILENVLTHPRLLAPFLQDTYNVDRLDVYDELRKLVEEGVLAAEGSTGTRSYRLLKFPEPEAKPEPVMELPRPNTIMERERLERLAWQKRRKH